jgi:hypothetical protein
MKEKRLPEGGVGPAMRSPAGFMLILSDFLYRKSREDPRKIERS